MVLRSKWAALIALVASLWLWPATGHGKSRPPPQIVFGPGKEPGTATIQLRHARYSQWSSDGEKRTRTRTLRVSVPVGVADQLLRAARTGGLRYDAAKTWIGMELRLVAGTGDQTVMLDRKDYTRIQFGQDRAARSYWLGRTRVGTNVGMGTFLGNSGKSRNGATLINPTTLAAARDERLDQSSLRWYAVPTRKRTRVEPAAPGQTVPFVDRLTSRAQSTSFAGVASVSTKGYVALGTTPGYAQQAQKSCAVACSRMAIATATGQIVPERELQRLSSTIPGGYEADSGTYLKSLPALLEQHGVIGRYLEGLTTGELAQRLKSGPRQRKFAVVSLRNIGASSNHAVILDAVNTYGTRTWYRLRDPDPRLSAHGGRNIKNMDHSEFVKRFNGRCVIADTVPTN